MPLQNAVRAHPQNNDSAHGLYQRFQPLLCVADAGELENALEQADELELRLGLDGLFAVERLDRLDAVERFHQI